MKKKQYLNQNIIRIIEGIEKILIKLKDLINKGIEVNKYYQIEINLKREKEELYENWIIKSKNENIIEKSEINKPGEIIHLIYFLENIEKEQLEYKEKYYEENVWIRLIYGKQFTTIYNYIKDYCNKNIYLNKKNDINKILLEEEIIYLNKFITNNKISKIDFTYDCQNDKNIEINMYKIINDYINELTKNININKLYQNSVITLLDELKQRIGFYPYYSKNPEIESLKLFKILTNNLPNAQNILICNENTNNEEIYSFLYRTFLDEMNRLYIIINSDKLDVQKSNFLIQKLNDFKTNKKMHSLLLFINKNKSSDLFDQINVLNNKKFFEINELNKENKKEIKSDLIEVIYSFKSGVGKSKYIKYCFKKEKKKYIYFPIGECSKKDLFNRLKSVLREKNIGLHIDILEIEKEEIKELINEFFFSFLIMNYYSYNESLCLFKDSDIKIKIEIKNIQKYQILNLFHQKGIYKISIDKFVIYTKDEVIKQKEQEKNKNINNNIENRFNYYKKKNKYKIIENNSEYEKLLSNNQPFYIYENEIYFQNYINKKYIIYEKNYLIIKKEITTTTDLIFNNLKISSNLDSDIQITCNYLSLLKNEKLNETNIFFFDNIKRKEIDLSLLINTQISQNYLNYLEKNNYDKLKQILLKTKFLNLLNEEECRSLLLEYYIKNNKNKGKYIYERKIYESNENYQLDNFYSLLSFLKIFSSQIKQFVTIKTFYNSTLKDFKKIFYTMQPYIQNIRPFMIKSLLNNALISSKSAFFSILNQNDGDDYLKKWINFKKHENLILRKKKDIEQLTNREIPFFNFLDNDLIIMNENNDNITIISDLLKEYFGNNLDSNEKEKKKMKKIYY